MESLSPVLEEEDFPPKQEGKPPVSAYPATPLSEVPKGSSRVCANPGEAGFFCDAGFFLRLRPACVSVL